MSANEKAWLPQTGVDKAKVLEMLNNTLVGKKAEAEERHKYAISLKKLHSLSNILRGQGYPVSFKKSEQRNVVLDNFIEMSYRGNTVFGFRTKERENSKYLEFPLVAFIYHSQNGIFAGSKSNLLTNGIALARAEALSITEKSEDGDAVIKARNSIKEIDDKSASAEKNIEKFEKMRNGLFFSLGKIIQREDTVTVQSEDELVSLISRTVKICKEFEEKGLFTLSMKQTAQGSNTVTYKREILGSLYDSLKITEQVVKYPALKK